MLSHPLHWKKAVHNFIGLIYVPSSNLYYCTATLRKVPYRSILVHDTKFFEWRGSSGEVLVLLRHCSSTLLCHYYPGEINKKKFFFLGEPTIFYWDSSGFLFRVFCTALCDDARSKQASILRSSPLHCGFGWGPIHLGKACFEICFFAAFANKQTLCPLRKKGQKTNERERKAKS